MLSMGDRTFHVVMGLSLIGIGAMVVYSSPDALALLPLAFGIGGGFALGGAVIDYVRGL